MKQLLNTLYVTTPDAYLSKEGQNVVVSVDQQRLFSIPIINVESIVTFGYQGASPGLMRLCAENGVALSFFSPAGRFVARSQGPVNGNILLRKRQFGVLDDMDERKRLSSRFIYGKVYNSRAILRRFVRDYPSDSNAVKVAEAAKSLQSWAFKIKSQPDLDVLRGYEGEAAAVYFEAMKYLVLSSESCFSFSGRSRRPPTDPFNAMLSFGYALLANDCASALEGVGLDPAAGFMHSLRPGRVSLALDLMEELRGFMVDRFVISIINNRQMAQSDFKIHTHSEDDNPASVILTDDGRKKFLAAWQARKKVELTHPFIGEKVKVGLLPHIQAMLLARNLRKDLDDYPMFLIK